jgi:hypothetical protein
LKVPAALFGVEELESVAVENKDATRSNSKQFSGHF